MSDESLAGARRIIADAMEDAEDGLLDAQRLESVRQLLRTSAEARRYYLQANELRHALFAKDIISGEMKAVALNPDRGEVDTLQRTPGTIGFGKRSRVAGVAVAFLLLVVLAWLLTHEPPNENPQIVSLEYANGTVSVTDANVVTRVVASGDVIRQGDIVRTQGSLGSAMLTYPDGTRLSLAGNASLTLSGRNQKRVVLHGGTLFASVTPQPAGKPLVVATPQDEVQVLGTRFSLDATTVETDLSVSEGRVRLTRLQDGRTVEVPAGRRVVSNAASALVPEVIPKRPDEWSEDFEDGLPEDWETGKFVASDLPPESKGAVRAVRDPSEPDAPSSIVTGGQWTRGLFAIQEDTHLHFTLKMQDPGWFNILILTRTEEGDPPTFAGNYIFDQAVWFGRPGQWGTVSIPLSEFRPLPPSRDDFKKAIPFQIVFSSPDKDRGLVIDRVWVSRGGPGSVEARVLE